MKKITLFSAGGIVLAILLVLLAAGAKTNTALSESTVSETLVADTTAVTETEKMLETTETVVIEPSEKETTTTTETTEPPKAKEITTTAIQCVKSESEPEEHGLIIGDYHEPAQYNCGVAGHHCEGPETHSYICELEQKGCEYCGSHNCPSFYAVDQWGQGCYTPSKCPKYDIHADPVYYCQTCHQPCGDGRNGTCVQFVVACACPNCGEQVSAWTCHYCE